jgi:RNA polymerase sigma-32 factor
MAHIDDLATQRANLGYIRASMAAPLLSRDHEFDLARRWRDQGDERALHELVRAYARLVVAQAGRFRSYGLPMGDLMQEGNVGLMQAAARFEPDRQVRFSTYAAWWVRSTMQEYVLRNWSIVRTGTTAAQKTLFFNLRRLKARLESARPSGWTDGSLQPETRRSIAIELAVDEAEVDAMAERLAGSDRSLNVPVGSGRMELEELVADQRPSPEETVIDRRDGGRRQRWLSAALDELNPRERDIIAWRRLSEDGATLEELGHRLGVSKERVRQLECRALDKLRRALLRHVHQPADLYPEG